MADESGKPAGMSESEEMALARAILGTPRASVLPTVGLRPSDTSLIVIAERVLAFTNPRAVEVPERATLPNLRERFEQPYVDTLTGTSPHFDAPSGECERCGKTTYHQAHECTWSGGPRPIGLSRERVFVDSIDRRIMVRQWALEGCVTDKAPAVAQRKHTQLGRWVMCARKAKDGASVNICGIGHRVFYGGGRHQEWTVVDDALRHEAEEWRDETNKGAT